jgi:hypothetical protein
VKTTDSSEGPAPLFDACAMPILKLAFIALRLFLRLSLGRRRRDKIDFLEEFWLDSNDSPSYLLIAHLYNFLNKNKKHKGVHLLKIYVPRYHYKYFCRMEKGDFLSGHEDHILARFAPKEGDVVVDIGAHIGRYTITSSRMVGNSGRVIAIEADRDTFQMPKKM